MKNNKAALRIAKGGSKSRKKNNQEKVHKAKKSYEVIDEPVQEIDTDEFIVVGKNPVLEALRSDLQIERILVLRDNTDHVISDITRKAKNKNLVVQSVDKKKLESVAEGRPHQGVAALLAPFPYANIDDVIEENKDKEDVVFVICDHITDPHNFGAIIRNAEVCGSNAVIFPQRRSAGLSPSAVKASSGAAAYIPLCKVNNLSQTISKLKEEKYWIAGADINGENVYNSNLKGKIAVVLGAEGPGLSPKIRNMCDFIITIPNYGKVDSMNVSSAAAVILSEAARQQHS